MEHPLLDDSFYIRWSQITPDIIEADMTEALRRAEANLDDLAGTDRGRMTFEDCFLGLEAATEELSKAWSKVSHLDSVCNSDELREAYNKMIPAVTEFWTKLYLNESIWDLFQTFAATDEGQAVSGLQRRFMDETMEDFRESGAELGEAEKKRLEELAGELAQATQKFGENVLDATNAWELVIEDESKLAGLPQSAIDAARQSAEGKGFCEDGKDAWRFTLQATSWVPVLEHLEDEEIRQQVWEASSSVASEGEHDNTELIWQILKLRDEKAKILGSNHFADKVLARRMAKNGDRALSFIEDLAKKVTTAFGRENTQLQEFRAEATGASPEPFQPWQLSFWAEKQRVERFEFDDEELRPYFPIDGVIAGMFEITERIFDIQIVEKESVFIEPGTKADATAGDEDAPIEVWHPEVKVYEIQTKDGTPLGSFYADWHPRESKRGGAWMNNFRTGRPPTEEEDREPHLGLICGNLTPSVGDKPALLKHDEVVTVFHEFGHLLHHLLGEVEIRSLNGINVAWDFVELPSQFLENFCWERESLDLFARHYETGEVIPAKLFKRMIAARNYMSANAMMRQLGFSKLDLELHMKYPNASDRDLDELSREILDGYRVPLLTEAPSMARRFSHLFSSPTGYAAGYYSYKWAEVLDADCFTRFQKEGILNPKAGKAFRDEILSRGNSEDPDALFRNFMGRDPDPKALLERSGL